MIRGFQIPVLLVGTCLGVTAAARSSFAAPQDEPGVAAELRGSALTPLQAPPVAPTPPADVPAAPPVGDTPPVTDPAAPPAGDTPPATDPAAPPAGDVPVESTPPSAPPAGDVPVESTPPVDPSAPSEGETPPATDASAPSRAADPAGQPPLPQEPPAAEGSASVGIAGAPLSEPLVELQYPGYVPGYRTSTGIGLSPYAPGTTPPLGGTTPSFGATIRPQQWNVDFRGTLDWFMALGIGKNGQTGATAIHFPYKSDEGYEGAETNASFGFVMTQGPISAEVGYNTNLDGGAFEVTYLPTLIPEWQLEVSFGTAARYYSKFRLEGGTGVFTRTEWQADPYLAMTFNQALWLKPNSDNGNTELAQVYSVGGNFDGIYEASLGFFTTRSQDVAPVKYKSGARDLAYAWTRDQQAESWVLNLRWFGEEYGSLGGEVSYSVSRGALASPGALVGDYFGRYMGLNKSAASFSTNYDVSIFRFMDPGFYDPDGRDLKFKVGFGYDMPIDPLPAIKKLGASYRYNLGLSYRILGNVVVWSDYNWKDPSTMSDDASDTEPNSNIETTVQFKTAALSPEVFEIAWEHQFLGKFAQLSQDAGTKIGDIERFEIRAKMWW